MKWLIRTELVPSAKGWGTIVDPSREPFKETNGDITILKREGLAKISSCRVDTRSIGSKMTRDLLVNIKKRKRGQKPHFRPYSAY